MSLSGRCACGRTTYVIAGDAGLDVATCHCETCRRSTGGTHVTWATVAREAFRWTGAPPASYRSSEHGTRFFCSTCGAQLALYTELAPTSMDVSVSTLDHPELYPPTRDIWLSRKLPWVALCPGLPGEAEETL